MWSGAAADCVNGVLLTWLRDLRGLGAGKGKGMEGGQDGGGGGTGAISRCCDGDGGLPWPHAFLPSGAEVKAAVKEDSRFVFVSSTGNP